jgi:hypothetical protein
MIQNSDAIWTYHVSIQILVEYKDSTKIEDIFWLTLRKSILAKDNLLKRGWHGDDTFHFCGRKEKLNCLSMSCSMAILI